MSERESEQGPAESGAVPEEPAPAVEPARPPGGSPGGSHRTGARAALWLAGLPILILAGVALSPFWAPQIEPLFPWGENRDDYAALAARVAAVEARPVAPSKGVDAVQSATSELARRVGNPKASRAVGSANGANPLPIVIPCHRVIAGDGTLGGFGGGLTTKQTLLDLERRASVGNRAVAGR